MATNAGDAKGRSVLTAAVHAGEAPRVDGAAVFPIHQSATFLYQGEASYDSVRYTRCNNNPSQLAVARKLAALEGAEAAMVTSSGMAAISTAFLALLQPGDHFLVQSSVYGGTYSLLHHDLGPRLGYDFSTVDSTDPSSWEAHLRPNTKLFYVETISNPVIRVPDLPAVVAFAKRHNLLTVIDNTFASPVNFRPVEIGFDLVLESATKFLNGHSDVIAGVFAGRAAVVEQVTKLLNHLGGTLDPHAAFLLQRGIKTVGLRVRQQNANALALAKRLQSSDLIAKVHYPGLESHPQHALCKELFTGGFGGVLAFEFKGGVAAAEAFMNALELALVAPSLGGVETLITRPATTTHIGLTPEQRAAVGVSDGLVRMAVGVEDTEDLLRDVERGLLAAANEAGAP